MFLLLSLRSTVADVKKVLGLARETQHIIGGCMDVMYIGVGLLFFALCWGFLALCERL
jgi:hypothetical protein